MIVAHLGSGASMCALAGGRSIESTMGFTALDGIPMGTRSGQIDPGVLLYMLGEKGMSAKALEDLLYRESGLKGFPGSAMTCGSWRRARACGFASDRAFCLSDRTECRDSGCGSRRPRCIRFHCWHWGKFTHDP